VNDPLDCPLAITILAGTVTFALFEDRDTVNPPVPAAPDRVTVHEELAGVVSVDGVQLNPETATVTGRLIEPEPPVAGIPVPDAVEATTPVS